jgi:hypothetical protein
MKDDRVSLRRVDRPSNSALTCHRRPVAAVSYEDLLDSVGLPMSKYWPLTSSTCADQPRYIDVTNTR